MLKKSAFYFFILGLMAETNYFNIPITFEQNLENNTVLESAQNRPARSDF